MELLEAVATTRAIRRYRPEPIPEDDLATILWAASRAPSGSNRQPFRFVVLRDSPAAREAKALLAAAAAAGCGAASGRRDGYDEGSGADGDSPKARMAAHACSTSSPTSARRRSSCSPASWLPRARRRPRARRSTRRCRTCCSPPATSATAVPSPMWHSCARPALRDAPRHPRRRRDRRHHPARQAPRLPRPGAAPADRRAGVRGPMGQPRHLGRGPTRHPLHPGRASRSALTPSGADGTKWTPDGRGDGPAGGAPGGNDGASRSRCGVVGGVALALRAGTASAVPAPRPAPAAHRGTGLRLQPGQGSGGAPLRSRGPSERLPGPGPAGERRPGRVLGRRGPRPARPGGSTA